MFPEVDSLKKTLAYNEGKCNLLGEKTKDIEFALAIFKYAMVAAFMVLMMVGPAIYVLRLVRDRKS
jgi:hypothetical protein